MTELIALLTSVGGGWAYPAMAFFAFLESAAFVGLVIPGETAMLLGGVLAATSQVSLFDMIAGGVTVPFSATSPGTGLAASPGPRFSRAGWAGGWGPTAGTARNGCWSDEVARRRKPNRDSTPPAGQDADAGPASRPHRAIVISLAPPLARRPARGRHHSRRR